MVHMYICNLTYILTEHAAPGIAAAVLVSDGRMFVDTVGRFRYDINSTLMSTETQFDMASLTKVCLGDYRITTLSDCVLQLVTI